jgi:hypothetical protein
MHPDGRQAASWNAKQRAGLAVGIGLCLLMGLFPPLAEEHWSRKGYGLEVNNDRLLDSRFIGYGFQFGRESKPLGHDQTLEHNIVWWLLLGQWILVTAVTAVAVRLLRRRDVDDVTKLKGQLERLATEALRGSAGQSMVESVTVSPRAMPGVDGTQDRVVTYYSLLLSISGVCVIGAGVALIVQEFGHIFFIFVLCTYGLVSGSIGFFLVALGWAVYRKGRIAYHASWLTSSLLFPLTTGIVFYFFPGNSPSKFLKMLLHPNPPWTPMLLPAEKYGIPLLLVCSANLLVTLILAIPCRRALEARNRLPSTRL